MSQQLEQTDDELSADDESPSHNFDGDMADHSDELRRFQGLHGAAMCCGILDGPCGKLHRQKVHQRAQGQCVSAWSKGDKGTMMRRRNRAQTQTYGPTCTMGPGLHQM